MEGKEITFILSFKPPKRMKICSESITVVLWRKAALSPLPLLGQSLKIIRGCGCNLFTVTGQESPIECRGTLFCMKWCYKLGFLLSLLSKNGNGKGLKIKSCEEGLKDLGMLHLEQLEVR